MTPGQWALAAGTAVAAALLVNAGVAKLVSPGQLRRAATELSPLMARYTGTRPIRGLGAAELVTSAGLLIAPVRLPAAFLATVLGASFAALGALGLARGSSLPCGCFGSVGTRPLGWPNIWLGAALGITWPALMLAGSVPAVGNSLATLLLAPVAVMLMCLWLSRSLVEELRRAPRGAMARSEVR